MNEISIKRATKTLSFSLYLLPHGLVPTDDKNRRKCDEYNQTMNEGFRDEYW